MADLPRPPKAFEQFVARFPKAGEAWTLLGEAAAEAGPLDERTQRLIKLALAIGAGRPGAAHSGVRKALAAGVRRDEMEQVACLAAATLGLPGAVAAHQWILEALGE